MQKLNTPLILYWSASLPFIEILISKNRKNKTVLCIQDGMDSYPSHKSFSILETLKHTTYKQIYVFMFPAQKPTLIKEWRIKK